MATSKSYLSRQNYRFLSTDCHAPITGDSSTSGFELDESDVYNSFTTLSNSPEFRKAMPSSRYAKKSSSSSSSSSPSSSLTSSSSIVGGTPASLPVNVPDWSKILKGEYRNSMRREGEGEEDDDVTGEDWSNGKGRVPPHELLARTRMASFSVHEGIGRTLKGRDLSRVRNAIWEKTGFQD